MARSPRARVPRDRAELVETLRQERDKLWEFGQLAFREGREEYLGEVAGKLGLLVCETRTNKPLLLGLMNEFGVEVGVRLADFDGWTWMSGDKGGETVSLEKWLNSPTFAAMTSAGPVQMTPRELILTWAQQKGAAHQDWHLDEALAIFLRPPLPIAPGSCPIPVEWLKQTTEIVVKAAVLTLSKISGEPLEQAP